MSEVLALYFVTCILFLSNKQTLKKIRGIVLYLHKILKTL
jgi:hypothetical protein